MSKLMATMAIIIFSKMREIVVPMMDLSKVLEWSWRSYVKSGSHICEEVFVSNIHTDIIGKKKKGSIIQFLNKLRYFLEKIILCILKSNNKSRFIQITWFYQH